MAKMTQLSICMPSNRNLQKSRAAIETALIYADKADCLLIVSDNSGDAAKRAHFENMSARLVYIVPEGDDPLTNMMTVLSHVNTPFVMPMGDDDEVYRLDDQVPVRLGDLPGDAMGVRPQTYIWTNAKGVQQVDRFAIAGEDAGERILEYNSKARGNNSLYYSTYRTDVYLGLFRLYEEAHPTRGGYCDWALSFAFVAGGKFLYDPSTIYRYDLGRWSGEKNLAAAKSKLFTDAGLPANAEDFSNLLRFVDAHGFLMWTGLPLSTEERGNAVTANARLALGTFLNEVDNRVGAYDEETRYLADLIRQTRDVTEAFQIALVILDRLQPGLSARYARFYNAALGLNA